MSVVPRRASPSRPPSPDCAAAVGRHASTVHLHRALSSLVLVLLASGCTLASDYRISDGARTQRSYRSVAGSVHIGRDAAIHDAKTVAGAIHVDDGASTQSLSSVAGEIHIGERATVQGDVSTVAGDIRIDAGTRVTGSLSSTAGAIELNACRVDGAVRVTKGSIDTRGATLLPGGIVVRHAHSVGDERPTQIDIGPGTDVASIDAEPDTEVDLRVSRAARVGKVTGVTATYY